MKLLTKLYNGVSHEVTCIIFTHKKDHWYNADLQAKVIHISQPCGLFFFSHITAFILSDRLSQRLHLEMLSDRSRTETYRQVVISNSASLRNKKVMDLGCGTGIISLFCAQLAQPSVVNMAGLFRWEFSWHIDLVENSFLFCLWKGSQLKYYEFCNHKQ